jgi:hypothetical protein
LDHKNRNGRDNRISNLRLATQAQNCWNRKTPSNNKSGVKGVSWRGSDKRWRVEIAKNGKKIHLGMFKTFGEAVAVREAAEAALYGEFAFRGER